MKKYLIVEQYIKGTYITPYITRDDLVHLKKREIDHIFSLTDETYFDVESNSWKEIKK